MVHTIPVSHWCHLLFLLSCSLCSLFLNLASRWISIELFRFESFGRLKISTLFVARGSTRKSHSRHLSLWYWWRWVILPTDLSGWTRESKTPWLSLWLRFSYPYQRYSPKRIQTVWTCDSLTASLQQAWPEQCKFGHSNSSLRAFWFVLAFPRPTPWGKVFPRQRQLRRFHQSSFPLSSLDFRRIRFHQMLVLKIVWTSRDKFWFGYLICKKPLCS